MHPQGWTLGGVRSEPRRSIPMKKVPASEATRKRLEEVFSAEH
jgi:hypothetical protein